MGRVIGVGGVFFTAKDPQAVRAWYQRVLGVDLGGGSAHWAYPDKGVTVLSVKTDASYFAPSTQPFMINLIVEDLAGLLAKAEAAGVKPLGREDHEYGKFAWLLDPAGVKVELWEPV
jgi:catechol 2,3-dioxygenase-like lactoylglutathione lyase family enzyme